MFGAKKNENTVNNKSSSNGSASHALNSLVQGTEVKGTITSDSDIRVDGTLIGDLNCSAKMIIGKGGSIEGNVECENALIEGNFKGNLVVKGTLHIKETATVEGDLNIGKLAVDPGAEFNVTCNMGAVSTTSKSKSKKFAEEATS